MASVPSNPGAGNSRDVSVVIPTYRRGAVLLDTVRHLLALDPSPCEILVVDQTESPAPDQLEVLQRWEAEGRIRRIAFSPPSIPQAMNRGVLEARGGIVLFLDDDVVPRNDLVACHQRAHAEHSEAWAVVGQVIQPEDEGGCGPAPPLQRPAHSSILKEDLRFSFAATEPAWVSNVIACHLSVKREKFMAVGGFDANFIPPVSYRFETEFAKRLVAAGGRIFFDPRASLRHLRAGSGGTRSRGSHLASASPRHGVGDYYYALRWGRGWGRVAYMVRRPFREVRTRFHLAHPWYIPVKFIGEMRAMVLAFRLYRSGPRLIEGRK